MTAIHCSVALGQKVKIIGTDESWKLDWIGKVLTVVGMALDRKGEINLYLSLDWPNDGGFDEVKVSDVEIIA